MSVHTSRVKSIGNEHFLEEICIRKMTLEVLLELISKSKIKQNHAI